MSTRTSLIVFAAASLAFATGCDNKIQTAEQTLAVPFELFESVSAKRIVFAHQSVGGEILRGVENLAKQTGAAVPVVESRESPAQSGISHFKVGENGNPRGKIQDFVAAMSRPEMATANIALLKLCYIDFNDSTDGKALAVDYVEALQQLAQTQPNTRFVAVTAPLTTIQTGPKAWLKRALGKQPAGHVVNARRHDFNEALRSQVPASNLFDVAKIESENSTFEFDGRRIEALDPALTYDGGHLNEAGQGRIAAALIEFLAKT